MKRTIVCFANSRKPGGLCFAGKNLLDKKWIRPIKIGEHDSLLFSDECIKNEFCLRKANAKNNNLEEKINSSDKKLNICDTCNPIIPKLLDIVEVDLKEYCPNKHQTENFILESEQWKKIGRLVDGIDNYIDKETISLWINGYQKGNRLNDCFPSILGSNIVDSLKLIEVPKLEIIVKSELNFMTNKLRKRVSGKFVYKNVNYIIPITDQVVECLYLQQPDGEYEFDFCSKDRLFLCISLGLEFNGYIYKLISGVISLD